MLTDAEKNFLKIGFKEVLKAIKNANIKKVFIANDSSASIKDKLLADLSTKECEVVYIETMKELGKICGIDVGASVAAILKN